VLNHNSFLHLVPHEWQAKFLKEVSVNLSLNLKIVFLQKTDLQVTSFHGVAIVPVLMIL
jgi:hypothetical protein